ncbi:MAG TPA: GNAT family N-acetyltransferase [Abditibacteriaceae bacterium]
MISPSSALEIHARVSFRALCEEDTSHLEWHGGAELRAWYQEQWQRHQQGKISVVVADFNSFPIGQAAVHWSGKPTHPHIPDMQSLRVFGAFRGFGIGSGLMQSCEQLVRERGFAQVSLAVALDNPRAQMLYERCGYVATGAPYDDEWHYVNARGETVEMCEHVQDMVKEL